MTAHPFPIVSDSAGRWPSIWASDANTFDVAWSDLATDTLIASYSGLTTTADAVLASTALAQGSADAAAASAALAALNASSNTAVAAAASASAAATSATAAAGSATGAASSATAASGSATAAAGSATAAAASAASAAAIVGFNPTVRTISAAGLASGGGTLAADRTITVTKSSQAQAQAGTDDTTAMTPLRVSDAITALGNAKYAVVSKTASYTHTAAENKKLYEFSGALGSAVALTIDPTILTAGGWCGLHNTGTGPMRVVASSGTIDGRSAIVLYPGERFLVRSDGTNLRTIGRATRWLVESAAPSAVAAVNFELAFTANNGAADPEMSYLEYEFEGSFTTSFNGRFKSGGAYVTAGYYGTQLAENSATAATTANSAQFILADTAAAGSGCVLRARLDNPLGTTAGVSTYTGWWSYEAGVAFGRTTGKWVAQNAALQGLQFTSGGTITGVARCYINRSIL